MLFHNRCSRCSAGSFHQRNGHRVATSKAMAIDCPSILERPVRPQMSNSMHKDVAARLFSMPHDTGSPGSSAAAPNGLRKRRHAKHKKSKKKDPQSMVC